MAVRLSVVMVHSTPATSTAESVAQGVVGELIGLSGIDLILVAPLDSLTETSTDRLTLSSLGGDIAVLDWRLTKVMQESLKRIGVEGVRTRHAADPDVSADAVNSDASDAQSRKLYLFNLTEFTTAEAVISSLTKLNEARAVRTFSLAPIVKRPRAGEPAQSGGPAGGSEAASGMPSSETRGEKTRTETGGEKTRTEPTNRDDMLSQQSPAGSSVQEQTATPTQRTPAVSPDCDDHDLDALIDQLDQLDP